MLKFNDIVAFFEGDKFVKSNGITIKEVSEGSATVAVKIGENHLNAGGVVQGGLIFTLADFAFAVHANANGKMTVSQSASISYLKPSRATELSAVATPTHIGRTTVVYNVAVYDEKNAQVACVTINGFIKA